MELRHLVARGEAVLESIERERQARLIERTESLRRILNAALTRETWEALSMDPMKAKLVEAADSIVLVGDVFSGQVTFVTTQQGIIVKFWASREDEMPIDVCKLVYGDRDHGNVDRLCRMLARVNRKLRTEQKD